MEKIKPCSLCDGEVKIEYSKHDGMRAVGTEKPLIVCKECDSVFDVGEKSLVKAVLKWNEQ